MYLIVLAVTGSKMWTQNVGMRPAPAGVHYPEGLHLDPEWDFHEPLDPSPMLRTVLIHLGKEDGMLVPIPKAFSAVPGP